MDNLTDNTYNNTNTGSVITTDNSVLYTLLSAIILSVSIPVLAINIIRSIIECYHRREIARVIRDYQSNNTNHINDENNENNEGQEGDTERVYTLIPYDRLMDIVIINQCISSELPIGKPELKVVS